MPHPEYDGPPGQNLHVKFESARERAISATGGDLHHEIIARGIESALREYELELSCGWFDDEGLGHRIAPRLQKLNPILGDSRTHQLMSSCLIAQGDCRARTRDELDGGAHAEPISQDFAAPPFE